MKLLNKKGFALVETLIVTVFVMTMFILIYQNVVPMIGEYEKMANYDDIDSIYAANLYKQVLLRYGDLSYIDQQLNDNSYLDISDCNDTNIYTSSDYCNKIKVALNVSDSDNIFITNYDISRFRQEVKENEYFDSGKLSDFKSYVNTVGNVDSFYDPTDTTQIISGKYRIFMTRTVTNSDNSTTLKYTNLGIFLGDYQKYNFGEKITFDPGDGEKEFYVLKNSSSKDSTVTLILANNLEGTTVFNTTGTNNTPTQALSLLKSETDSWVNVESLTSSDNFVSSNGYTISYDGYRARLLDENDIYTLLGCSDNHSCFDIGSLFSVSLNTNLTWLYDNLDENNGYWLANAVLSDDEMAWSIQSGLIKPTEYTNDSTIGVRPVIVVSKDKLSVGDSE